MESEEFGNYSSISFDNNVAQRVIPDVVFTLICLVAAMANTILIYIIFKFRRLHTVPNFFLANWAIADLATLLTTPSTYRLIAMLDNISLSGMFMCSLYGIGAAAQVTLIIYVFLLTLDWCLAAYFENASMKFRKYTKFYIFAIWIFMFLFLCLSIVFCINRHFFHGLHAFMVVFGFMGLFLFVTVLQICRAVRKCRRRTLNYPTIMLTITTSFVLSWFAAFVNVFAMFGFGIFHRSVEYISATLLFCTSIIVFIIFYRGSPDFQACLSRLFRRNKINYEEADFNFHSTGRKPIVKNISHCSFNNKEQNVFVC
ncbi:hypothetical protein FQR65_LT09535 [Abscondita terminalis]|nr:hypothetical protein FQR65_LT09535 [Abscondita terminalis]